MRTLRLLRSKIVQVMVLMRVSDGKDHFVHMFERAFGKQLQLRLQLLAEYKELTK